jgi:hypothetical protein
LGAAAAAVLVGCCGAVLAEVDLGTQSPVIIQFVIRGDDFIAGQDLGCGRADRDGGAGRNGGHAHEGHVMLLVLDSELVLVELRRRAREGAHGDGGSFGLSSLRWAGL